MVCCSLGEVRQEVDEDVGDGDAAGDREPDAARGDVEEAHLASQEVYDGQDDHGEE